MARRGDYLYRRKGSMNWYVRFQYPPEVAEALGIKGTKVERSLGTSDHGVAFLKALPEIQKHKHTMLLYEGFRYERTNRLHGTDKQVMNIRFVPEIAPGSTVKHADGSMTIATADLLIDLDPAGMQTGTRPNTTTAEIEVKRDWYPDDTRRGIEEIEKKIKGTKARVDPDKAVIEDYIKEAGLDNEDANRVRLTLRQFKDHFQGKPLILSSIRDAKDFISHLLKHGRDGNPLATSTVKRRIAQIKAAINLNLKSDTPSVARNVWADLECKLYPKDGDEQFAPILPKRRPPFSEADIAAIRSNMHKLTDEQRLMLVAHLATGIRPIGLYSIRSEITVEEEEQVGEAEAIQHTTRSWRIEKDKDPIYGPRVLPIPKAVLCLTDSAGSPLLPALITEPLFQTPLDDLLRQINNVLASIGVTSDGKTLYSGRHRAKYRLRKHSDQIRRSILGHSRQLGDSHGTYGLNGFGVLFDQWEIKEVIDHIGC